MTEVLQNLVWKKTYSKVRIKKIELPVNFTRNKISIVNIWQISVQSRNKDIRTKAMTIDTAIFSFLHVFLRDFENYNNSIGLL